MVTEGNGMNMRKLGAIVLIVAGTLSLLFGTFSYGRSTQRASIGAIEIAVSEPRTVNVPSWAGVVAIAAGAAVLLVGLKDRA
jgi:hypothetical protein